MSSILEKKLDILEQRLQIIETKLNNLEKGLNQLKNAKKEQSKTIEAHKLSFSHEIAKLKLKINLIQENLEKKLDTSTYYKEELKKRLKE